MQEISFASFSKVIGKQSMHEHQKTDPGAST